MGISIISGGGGSAGTVQGTDESYDVRATEEGSTAGDARGENSVDLQTNRYASTQVASAASATISGGKWNTASGDSSTVGGGKSNIASGANSTVAGGNGCESTAENASVLGGFGNDANGTRSGIVCGSSNEAGVGGTDAAILAGAGNEVNSVYSAVITGNGNEANATGAVVLTGTSTIADVPYSVVQGGRYLSANGKVHHATNVLTCATTNGTLTEATSDGSSGIDLDESDTLVGKYWVLSKRSNGDWAKWQETEFEITRTGSGNVVLLSGGLSAGAPDSYGNASGLSNGTGTNWRLYVDGYTTSQRLRFRFDGATGQNIRTLVFVRYLKVNY